VAILKNITFQLIGILFFTCLASQASSQPLPRAFEPGELIIGYQSPDDRERALEKLKETQNKVTVRGQIIDRVELKPVGRSALLLIISWPNELKPQMQADPVAELQILQELALHIKNEDQNIKYVHPNWIIDKFTLQMPQTE
jgi:hypothetical protein